MRSRSMMQQNANILTVPQLKQQEVYVYGEYISNQRSALTDEERCSFYAALRTELSLCGRNVTTNCRI